MKNRRQDNEKTTANQGVDASQSTPYKIGASTPYDFSAHNLTAYGGLLPVATMLEKLGFQQLVEETLSIGRPTRVMPVYRFVLAIVLALYVGFSRLNHLRFLERELKRRSKRSSQRRNTAGKSRAGSVVTKTSLT